MKSVLIAAVVAVAGAVGATGSPFVAAVVSANDNAGVCQPSDDHLKPPNETTKSVTVPGPGEELPEDILIRGYCVKAGSINQDTDENELGPVYLYFKEGDYRESVIITHPSGKDISHYIVLYGPADPPPRP